MKTPRLTAVEWIAAAFRRLGTGGIAAVRAEAIARDLKVSKGSFYWHFKDLSDLKAQMLEHWQTQATARIISMSELGISDPRARLVRLLDLATSDLADPYGGLSTEAAIRDWARTDPLAASAQSQADAARLAILVALLHETGLAADAAARNARLILMTYTGAVHLGVIDREMLQADLRHLLHTLLDAP